MKPKKQPGKKPNLQALIRSKSLHTTPPTDADIQNLLIAMLYDLPDDVDHHAGRARVKLDTLRALHQINLDSKVTGETNDLETDILEMLAKRRAKP